MSEQPQTDGEMALVLMDQEVLQNALKEIAHQSRDMAERSDRERVIMQTLLKHIPADKYTRALELLGGSVEREKWLAGQLQIAAKIVVGALELARTFQRQRDQEVRRRVSIESTYDRLVEKLENGETDDPLIEQFLGLVGDTWYDLEG